MSSINPSVSAYMAKIAAIKAKSTADAQSKADAKILNASLTLPTPEGSGSLFDSSENPEVIESETSVTGTKPMTAYEKAKAKFNQLLASKNPPGDPETKPMTSYQKAKAKFNELLASKNPPGDPETKPMTSYQKRKAKFNVLFELKKPAVVPITPERPVVPITPEPPVVVDPHIAVNQRIAQLKNQLADLQGRLADIGPISWMSSSRELEQRDDLLLQIKQLQSEIDSLERPPTNPNVSPPVAVDPNIAVNQRIAQLKFELADLQSSLADNGSWGPGEHVFSVEIEQLQAEIDSLELQLTHPTSKPTAPGDPE